MTSIGAYLLGALDPQEHAEIERHLSTCEVCRQELIEMAHLPGLMHRLALEDVSQRASVRNLQAGSRPDRVPKSDAASQPFEATIAETSFWSAVVHRLSRSRILQLTMIMVLVLATTSLASAELLIHRASPGVVTWTSTNAAGGVDTVARLVDQQWGTDIRLWMDDCRRQVKTDPQAATEN
ncbi:anti-sigma factor [Kribbella sp. VKM Ac-2566]|uniref:anti-sigma factor family protein n=1 Tax=Kribbella sp. VKM Ac-2566 TaxID=2512218 RepID=UPI001417029D|nr:zf-HC2 domain-containing protein [Kribbella sp. VKM Ac-2566]